jgi:hypothetical protein
MANVETTVENVKNKAEQTAQQTVDNPWLERLVRLGYAARGLLYGVVGVLAVTLALGRGGATTDKNGALATIAGQPFGKFLLVLIVIGLVGYSLWGFVRALLDPLRRGTDAKGIAQRIGYAISGLSYGALILPTVGLITGSGNGGSGGSGPQDWTAKLMEQPFGPWLVGLIGVIGIAGGLGQLAQGVTTDFKKDFKTGEMSPTELTAFTWIGRFGLAARGVVFAMLGFFLIQAALNTDPNRAKGLDGALQTLLQQPHGPWLLGIVALGLVAFGLYSLLSARWIEVRKRA